MNPILTQADRSENMPVQCRPNDRACLLLAYWFPPSSESGAQRPNRFYKYLPKSGYDVSVTCGASGAAAETNQNGVVRVPEQAASAAARRLAQGVQRILPYNEGLDWLPAAVREGSKIIASQNVRVIISTSPPNCTALAALMLKRKFGIRWIADFRDPICGSPFRNRKFANIYDVYLERLIFRTADAVVGVTDVMVEGWRSRYPEYSNKIHLIWNGYDPEERVAGADLPLRKYSLLTHVGSVYGSRHPGALLASLLRLIEGGKLDPASIRVQLIGWIDPNLLPQDHSPVRELMAQGCLQIRNQNIPRQAALQAQAESDYLLLLDGNERNSAYAVPAKIFEYIQIGRPILAQTSPDSPVERILLRSGIPSVCIYPTDPHQIVDEKLALFLQLSNEARKPSAWFHEHFDGERQTRQLSAIIDGLLTA
jgi:glycosyltransferase involved in cell wall biosynthesis